MPEKFAVCQQPIPGDWVAFHKATPMRGYCNSDFFWVESGRTALVVSSHYHMSEDGDEQLLLLLGEKLWWAYEDEVTVIKMRVQP